MTIPFVTFNAIKSSEHLASHCVYFAMNAYVVVEYLRRNLKANQFQGLIRIGFAFSIISFVFAFVYLTFSGMTKWGGRSMTLLDPTYAKKYIPIIASVSEHQPTTWSNYFFDLGYILLLLPAGYYFLLIESVTIGTIFIAIYGVLATYFSCVMIRLMLTLAPVVCIIAGIALSEMFKKIGESIRHHMMSYDEETPDENDNPSKVKLDKKPIEAKPQSTKQKAKMTKEQRK
jgi:dolichyl-diphosphooligosaccharide--protein glycosyltransferase